MLQNAYFLAKIGADTAENEQHFAEILPTDALWRRRRRSGVRMPEGPEGRRVAPPRRRAEQPAASLEGSIGEGPNHSNFSDRSSVRILGIERKPRKATSSK